MNGCCSFVLCFIKILANVIKTFGYNLEEICKLLLFQSIKLFVFFTVFAAQFMENKVSAKIKLSLTKLNTLFGHRQLIVIKINFLSFYHGFSLAVFLLAQNLLKSCANKIWERERERKYKIIKYMYVCLKSCSTVKMNKTFDLTVLNSILYSKR